MRIRIRNTGKYRYLNHMLQKPKGIMLSNGDNEKVGEKKKISSSIRIRINGMSRIWIRNASEKMSGRIQMIRTCSVQCLRYTGIFPFRFFFQCDRQLCM